MAIQVIIIACDGRLYSAYKDILIEKSENMRASLLRHAAGAKGEMIVDDFESSAVHLFLQVLHVDDLINLGKWKRQRSSTKRTLCFPFFLKAAVMHVVYEFLYI